MLPEKGDFLVNCRVIDGVLFVEPCPPLVISALIPFCYTFIRFSPGPSRPSALNLFTAPFPLLHFP